MKYSMWIIAFIALTVSLGFAATTDNPGQTTQVQKEIVQVTQAQPSGDQPVSAEGQAEVKRKEFVDRLTALRDRESDLDRQAIALRQELENLQSRMEQAKLELKRVKVDQKDVQRNFKELEREKKIFDKKDKLRKKMDKLQSGN
jgi:chromosome segregation ATPase